MWRATRNFNNTKHRAWVFIGNQIVDRVEVRNKAVGMRGVEESRENNFNRSKCSEYLLAFT
jgi:hypothetical protein